jgi:mono/diheme cytochrome c family protein
MRNAVILGSAFVATALAFACSNADGTALTGGLGASSSSGGATGLDGGADDGGGVDEAGLTDPDASPAATNGNTGLPCDVQKVFEDSCIACHGGNQSPRLMSYADLVAPSPQFPGQTVVQRALTRMQSTTSPMPPAPAVAPTATEIAAVKAWVTAGTPMGAACNVSPDGGTSAGPPTNYNTPTVCTSGVTGTTRNGQSMDPGRACLACHQVQGGPRFPIGGTVYKTAHEPNQCNGVSAGVQVVVTDKNGVVTTLNVNSAGNFSGGGAGLVPPFSVKLTSGAKTRVMVGAVTAGDCNSCHTETGLNGAPGRIMAP